MKKTNYLILLLVFSGCKKTSFTDELNALFFKIDFSKPYAENIRVLRSQKLNESSSGFTIYPPLSALSDRQDNRLVFFFNQHPHIRELKNGQLITQEFGVGTRGLPQYQISCEFGSEKEAEEIYSVLVKRFSALTENRKDSKADGYEYADFRAGSNEPALRIVRNRKSGYGSFPTILLSILPPGQ